MRKPARESLLRMLSAAAVAGVLLAAGGLPAAAMTIPPPHVAHIYPAATAGSGPLSQLPAQECVTPMFCPLWAPASSGARAHAAPARAPSAPAPPALAVHLPTAQATTPHRPSPPQRVPAAMTVPNQATGKGGATIVLRTAPGKLGSHTTSRDAGTARGGTAAATQSAISATLARGYDDSAATGGALDPTHVTARPYVAAGGPDPSLWTMLAPMIGPRALSAAAAAPCAADKRRTCVYALGGIDDNGTLLNTAERYDPRTNRWTALAPMIIVRLDLAAAAAPCTAPLKGTCVYALAGDSTSAVLNSAEMYSPRTNTWTALPSMTTPRAYLAAAAAPCTAPLTGTCVYALGGQDDGANLLSTVEMYSPQTNTWTQVAPMISRRAGLAAAAASCPAGQRGTCVYAVGGVAGNSKLDTAEVYSPQTNTWTALAPMTSVRWLLGAAGARCPSGERGTCVYALGGFDAAVAPLSTAEVYTPETNTWTALPTMSTPRAYVAAAGARCPDGVRGTCAYALGGVDSTNILSTAEALIHT